MLLERVGEREQLPMGFPWVFVLARWWRCVFSCESSMYDLLFSLFLFFNPSKSNDILLVFDFFGI